MKLLKDFNLDTQSKKVVLPYFDCVACGECCRGIQVVPELKDLYDEEKSACKYLDQNNHCEIYDDRPEVCNYNKLYEKIKNKYSPDEYYRLTVLYCEELKILKEKRLKNDNA